MVKLIASPEVLQEVAEACDISQEEIEDVYGCTPFQSSAIVESAARPAANVLRLILRIQDSIDLDRFCDAFERVVAANSILRTRIVDSSNGILQAVTTRHFYMSRSSSRVEEYLQRDKLELMRWGCCLFRGALIGRRIVLTMHHSIMDYATTPSLVNDALRVYNGQGVPMRTPFKDFVQSCNGFAETEARAFWASRFKGTPSVFPRVDTGYLPDATEIVNRKVGLDMTELSMVRIPSIVEAAWAMTSKVYTGNHSVAFGVILSGRKVATSRDDLGDVIGPTIVAIPVQVDLRPGTSLGDVLRERTAARRELQATPFLQWSRTKIRAVSEAARSASAFQTLINLRPSVAEHPSEITHERTVDPLASFGLSLNCDLAENGLTIEAASDPRVIPSRQLNRVVNQFEHFLLALSNASLDTKIEQIKSLSQQDHNEILQWNQLVPPAVEACVHDLFCTQVRRSPGAAAVEAEDCSATYKELDVWSNRVANRLRQEGVQRGDTIAFIFEKSLWAIVSILSILKAGAVCVPVETSDPHSRQKKIVSASRTKIALVSSAYIASARGVAHLVIPVSAGSVAEMSEMSDYLNDMVILPEDLAFVIFTSGSTGEPKGVMLDHRSLATSLQHLATKLGWNSDCRILQFAAYVWDISIGEIFGTLLFGGCLCIPSEESRISNLSTFMAQSRVNWAWLTPTVIRTIFPGEVPNLEALLTIGEPVAPEAARVWGRSLRLVNGWGPCEASILCTTAELKPSSPNPESIGTAVNCVTWIVNADDPSELVPIGAVGELLIEGETVARGYLNDEVKTTASFISPQPWLPSSRKEKTTKLYRTGDVAKYYPDGSICFLGRRDNQVKIRGQRFELGEVESIIKSCAGVRDVVCRTKFSRGRTQLVAVLTLTDTQLPRIDVLYEVPDAHQGCAISRLRMIRNYVRSRLPSFMVPAAWLAVQELPRTPSAKLDRVTIGNWLKEKDLNAAEAALEGEPANELLQPPLTHLETRLQSIWSSILRIPAADIGRNSTFILLGGDSILAMQAASRCAKEGLKVAASAMLANMPLREVAKIAGAERESRSNTLDGAELASPYDSSLTEASDSADGGGVGVPATDAQALMLAIGENQGNLNNFILNFTPALDMSRLRRACERVIRHHPILRTEFIVKGSILRQIVHKEPPTGSVVRDVRDSKLQDRIDLRNLFPRFQLSSQDSRCHQLRLEIHHAFYDAISLGLIFQDLSAAYADNQLSSGPSFSAWISFQSTADKTAAREYWADRLQESSMSYLVTSHPQQIPCSDLDGHESISVPMRDLYTPLATSSTVLRAAWAILLSHALGTDDTVFGQVSANRYLPMALIDGVKGPCLNILPVRAQVQDSTTLAALVTRMQEDFIADMPHHHLGFREIIKECTPWPSWTRYSSILIYQNHTALSPVINFGNTRASLSGRDRLAGSTDIWIIATPFLDTLEIDLRFSSASIPPTEGLWISRCLTLILNTIAKGLSTTLSSVKAILRDAYPAFTLPQDPPMLPPAVTYNHSHPPSPSALRSVSTAWLELGLIHSDGEEDDNQSMFSHDADMVTVLLLSERYNVSIKKLLAHPSRTLQAYLLDAEAQ